MELRGWQGMTTMRIEPIRVGVVLLHLPERGVPALKYLIARMNSE